MLADRSEVDQPGEPQCPTECPTSLREIEAVHAGVHMCTAAREPTRRIRNEAVTFVTGFDADCHNS